MHIFAIFINDVVKHVKNMTITLYADDTAFLTGGSRIKELCKKMNKAAVEFAYWCSINKLTLNLLEPN